MRNLLFVLISIISILLFSCGTEETKQRNAIGGKFYGGEFKFMSSEKVVNLFPISSVDIYAQRLNSQIYQPLLTLDLESMAVVPSVAESYEVSEDAKTFTFKIRKGIKFHDDDCFNGKGRELTVEDVKYTLEMACSGLKINKMSYLLVNRIEGARNFYLKSKTSLPKSGVSGIRILNDSTLEIKLNESFIGFDKVLTHTNLGIFPHEAYEKYGRNIANHPVGTGPFMLEKMDASGVILKRNDNFWKKDEFGNQLPFLDRVVMIYAKDKKSELLAFRNKEIDLVLEIPVEEIENILGSLQDAQAGKNVKHKVESESSMSMNYVAFACQSNEFKNAKVRKAFNLAIDRNEVVEKWLKGEGGAAQNGFVPRLDNYPNEKITGDKLNILQAKALLANAGYPEGKGFPVLDFYVNAIEGSAPHKMCMGVAAQIKQNLGIDLKIKLCTLDERERAVLLGKAKIWRSGWIADYPDAENFLSLFYSGSINDNATEVNAFKFRNKEYDALFEQAIKELEETKRNSLFANCDQMVVDEAPVMPIMTDDFMVMINARIRDFQTNSMENLNFSRIYIKEPRKKN